ncbi:MAG: hypothetical protein LBT59_30970 [Clostridiales bacterium]|jgi:hypothetical protein|nr:hypothetical protein [Clostridiales bacterium]
MPQSNQPDQPLILLCRHKRNVPSDDSFDALKVFSDGISLISGHKEKRYALEDIGDVFLSLYPKTYKRVAVIFTIDKGKAKTSVLYERDFPGLQKAIGQVLKDGWGGFYEDRILSGPNLWINSVSATDAVAALRNPFVYAFRIKNPKFRNAEIERVSSCWEVKGKNDLLRMMAEQISQEVAYFSKKHIRPGMTKKTKTRAVKAIKVITLSKLMTLSLEGYACGWLSYEESLAWCLVSGKMLQSLCDDWDSYTQHMFDSYDVIKNPDIICNISYSGELFYSQNTEGKALQSNYLKSVNQLYRLSENFRQIPWFTPLDLKTSPAINAEKRALPSDFQYMPELGSREDASITAFRKPARDLAQCIESGECSVLDVEARLHIATSAVFRLKRELCKSSKMSEWIKDSFCNTVNRIFQFYSIGIDAFDVWKIHDPKEY